MCRHGPPRITQMKTFLYDFSSHKLTLTEAVNIIIIIINFVIGNCQDAISHDIYAITIIFETQIKQTKWAPKTTTTNK